MKTQFNAKFILSSCLVLALLGGLAGCNLPSGAPQPLTPTSPAAIVTVIPKQPEATRTPPATSLPPESLQPATLTPPPATPTQAPTPTATLPVVDRRDPQAVIDGVRRLIDQKDITLLDALLGGASGVTYVNYIEGGQPVERAKLQADLKARLSGSILTCDGYSIYENTLQIWTSGWTPDWQIDSLCYQGCATLKAPWKSSKAGFFFNTDAQGAYELKTLWLNENKIWNDVYKVKLSSCSQPYITTVSLTCPGAPKTRLKIGDQAYASTATSVSNRIRSAPGTGANITGLLQPGKAAEIIGGPACADGYIWWKIKPAQGNLSGWTAEGQGNEYWLVPCSLTGGCALP